MRVNDASGESFQLYPDMASGPDGTLHVVWEDFRNGEYRHGSDIYYANSSDGGQTWSADRRVNDDVPASAAHRKPHIAVSSAGEVYVVWKDFRNDPNASDPSKTNEFSMNPDIYLAKLALGQTSFGVNVLVYDQIDLQDAPDVEVDSDDDGHVFVIWADERNDLDNCYTGCSSAHDEFDIDGTQSSNGGGSWSSSNLMVNDDSNFAFITYPDVVFDPDGALVAVWRDQRSGDSNGDIYYAVSTDYGDSWSTNTRVDHAAGGFDAIWPVVVANPSGKLYALWQDYRNGDWDIYLTQLGS